LPRPQRIVIVVQTSSSKFSFLSMAIMFNVGPFIFQITQSFKLDMSKKVHGCLTLNPLV
jgi:hypothetical protein